MTPAQITRIQTKVFKLRKILAAERALFEGCVIASVGVIPF
jgi:hypothetical protein